MMLIIYILRYNEITAAMGNKFNDFFCLSKLNLGRVRNISGINFIS